MKKLEMIIRPDKVEYVKEILDKVGIGGITITPVMGYGAQKGSLDMYRGAEVPSNLLHKIKVEVVVEAVKVETIIEEICERIKTGNVGDGKIFISDIEDVVRIRTSERGKVAL